MKAVLGGRRWGDVHKATLTELPLRDYFESRLRRATDWWGGPAQV
jgi:hypothetical protein